MKRLIPPILSGKSQLVQFISFLFFILGSLFITISLTGLILKLGFQIDINELLSIPEKGMLNELLGVQFAQQIGLFLVPSFLLAYLASEKPLNYLALDKNISFKAIFSGMLIVLICLPFVNWLGQINSQMNLPESLSGVQEWMRAKEDGAGKITDLFLSVTTVDRFLINLFVIAVIPGIGEELLFRGVIQKMLLKWSKNEHLAVWLTAFVFSAIHIQFFGFLPRFILGALLGYLFVWSKSLWVPMFAHFLNNALAVTAAFYYSRQGIDIDIESIDMSGSIFVAILSGIAGIAALIYFRKSFQPSAPKGV